MIVKLRTLSLLLAMIGSTVVHAGLTINSKDHQPKEENMVLVMNESLYEIQQNTSTIAFRVDSPVGEIWVSFQDFEGRFAMLKNGQQDESVIVNINADSMDTDTGLIGMLLKSESFFDVENFPSMHFVGRSFEWYNETNAVLKGELTIQNITRSVAFYVELVEKNEFLNRIRIKATTTIKRSEFGIHALLPIVSDNVNLVMSIDAVKPETLLSML